MIIKIDIELLKRPVVLYLAKLNYNPTLHSIFSAAVYEKKNFIIFLDVDRKTFDFKMLVIALERSVL